MDNTCENLEHVKDMVERFQDGNPVQVNNLNDGGYPTVAWSLVTKPAEILEVGAELVANKGEALNYIKTGKSVDIRTWMPHEVPIGSVLARKCGDGDYWEDMNHGKMCRRMIICIDDKRKVFLGGHSSYKGSHTVNGVTLNYLKEHYVLVNDKNLMAGVCGNWHAGDISEQYTWWFDTNRISDGLRSLWASRCAEATR